MAAERLDGGRARPGGNATAALTADEPLLLARIARRDAAAFRLVVSRHLPAVVATARRILGDEAEAEDVAQETMLKLWSSAAGLELGPAGVRPWLARVAANQAIDRIRARSRLDVTDEPPEVADPPRQGRDLEDQRLADRVRAALSGLPERQRLALTLFHYEGLSQLEVGRALGVSDEAVESLLARARRALKAVLKDEWRDLIPDER